MTGDIYINGLKWRCGGAHREWDVSVAGHEFQIYVGQYDGIKTYSLHHKFLPVIHVEQSLIGEITDKNKEKKAQEILVLGVSKPVNLFSILDTMFCEGLLEGRRESQLEMRKALGLSH